MILFLSGCITGNSGSKENIVSLLEEIQPQIINHYKTEPETKSIIIKGRPQIIDKDEINDPSNIDPSDHSSDFVDLNDERTLFILINNTTRYIGTQTYIRDGQYINVNFYQTIDDVVVVYWPEKRIVGWHRVYGNSTIPKTIETTIGAVINPQTEKRILDGGLYNWIYSLPGWNSAGNPVDIEHPYLIEN